MTSLRVIADEVLGQGSTARYAAELVDALIRTAPVGTEVAGVVSSFPEEDYERLAELFPGLTRLEKSALAHRDLAAAWRRGLLGAPGDGVLHAPSLFAPLSRRGGRGQLAVSIHDTVAWQHPDLLPDAGRRLALARRAQRYADAVVVPSHSVAARLDEELGLGGRIRVIPPAAAARSGRAETDDADLPGRFVLTVSEWEHSTGLAPLATAVQAAGDPRLHLVIVVRGADPAIGAFSGELDPARIHVVPAPSPTLLARLHRRALGYVQADVVAGLPLGIADALAAGTPVIHSRLGEFEELAADSALVVRRGDSAELTDAIRALSDDDGLRDRLSLTGRDRARAFSWDVAGEQVWQLHAEL